MEASYDRLEREPPARRLADHSRVWDSLEPVAAASGEVRRRLEAFCHEKRITVDDLAALGARVRVRPRTGAVELAFAGTTAAGAVTAIKYRPLDETSRGCYAEQPSTWLRPIVAGNRGSLDWLVAEGETDAARLHGLVGDRCAILCLPAGAKVFRREWADLVPRGARVGLCLDADEAGDVGAEKAARLLGTGCYRVRPPAGDWCDWPGGRDEFLALAAAAAAGESRRFQPLTAPELMALPEPEGAELLGPLLLRGGRTIVGGAPGHGKTTLSLAIAKAVLTGGELLGYQGAGAGPILIVDLEQGVRSIKRSLAEAGLAEMPDVHILAIPDGLALDSDEREAAELERVVAELRPAVVLLDPYYKSHRGDANEERAVTDLMRRLDGLRARHGFALLLPAHVRKELVGNGARKLTLDDLAGSGALTRGAEVVLGIERLAHGFARLRYLKDRDGDLPVGEAVNLTYSKADGFRVKEDADPETKARDLGADGEWRTDREWAALLGCARERANRVLSGLAEAGLAEFELGPDGRSKRSKCWRIPATGLSQWGSSQ